MLVSVCLSVDKENTLFLKEEGEGGGNFFEIYFNFDNWIFFSIAVILRTL